MNNSITSREKVVRFNDSIRSPLVRLIDEGITVNNYEAKIMAKNRGLDLVEVSFSKDRLGNLISVCKICDHSKYIYEMKKAAKESAKKSKANIMEVKTIQFHITSDINDVNRKVKNAIEFLNDNNKVKLEIFLRGREQQCTNIIESLMDNILNNIPVEIRDIEINPRYDGRRYYSMLRPSKLCQKKSIIKN